MEPTIFGFLRRYAWKQQMLILALTAFTLPLGYATLELPKLIINRALGGDGPPSFFDMQWDRLELLWTLCGLFLVAVLLNGMVKYVVNVYAGVVSERMLRRLRYQLYDQVLRFPLPHFRRVSQGELVQMINAEVEPLGGFVGQAVTTPGLQGGTLLISLTFMFVQDPILGLAAIALYPLQVWLIPRLQAKVNLLGKARVRQVRRNAETISEMAGSVRDIRGNDATVYERARFSGELAKVFEIRFDIYKKKFLIKFLNNFLAQLGPFFFYAVGGYLVIQGDLTVGALVAVIGAQKDIASPWKELLSFYQTVYDVRIKYDQVIAQFVPHGMRKPELVSADPPNDAPNFERELRASYVTVRDDDGAAILDGVSFKVDLPTHLAVVGRSGSGKEELLLCIAGLMEPTSGRVTFDGKDVADLPESVNGRRMAFVGNPSHIFGGTIRDNLLYGLMHRPVREAEDTGKRAAYLVEAERSGNASLYPGDDWTDFAAVGIGEKDQRLAAMIELLELVRLDGDAYLMGLRGSIKRPDDDDLESGLLAVRQEMSERLAADHRLSRLVEPFDPERYNTNATLAENLLFGTTVGDLFDEERLAENAYVRKVLDAQHLTDELIEVGHKLAATMIELFADLPPDHEYFRQFSFIEADALSEYRALIVRADASRLDQLSEADRNLLLALPFKLVPARHRLGLVDDPLRQKILNARRAFREGLPEKLKPGIEFFDPKTYNHAASLQDNILFGKIAYGQAQAVEKIATLATGILKARGLRDRIIEVGLRTECGVGGARLSVVQRQKLGIARALMKRPSVLIMADATGPLDKAEAQAIFDAVIQRFQGLTVIWGLQEPERARQMRELVVLHRGGLAETGPLEELDRAGTAYRELLES